MSASIVEGERLEELREYKRTVRKRKRQLAAARAGNVNP